MKKYIGLFIGFILLLFLSINFKVNSQSFESGEYLKYRVHYLGINAGFATLNVKKENYDSKSHYHVLGKGWTVGATKLFFKVEDNYETYIDVNTNKPSKFIRKIDEGGYKKDKVLTFDRKNNKVTVNNKKDQKVSIHSTTADIQDMLSAFYYLRNSNLASAKTNDYVNLNIFMDEEIYPFRLKVLGRETIKSKYGKIKCIKIRPYVQKGRVFKANESVTMWVSDDNNHIPIMIKAELAVGSLKAELNDYKNIKTAFKFN